MHVFETWIFLSIVGFGGNKKGQLDQNPTAPAQANDCFAEKGRLPPLWCSPLFASWKRLDFSLYPEMTVRSSTTDLHSTESPGC
jgi:hypothetical protein